MGKRGRCFLRLMCCCIAFVLAVSCGFAAMGSSVFNRPKKHVYLVLDDSGSMEYYERDVDANYALQTLIAMTDKNDTLNVYFLNQDNKYLHSNKQDITGAVDLQKKSNDLLAGIKENYPKWGSENPGTPFGVVETAFEDMRAAVSTNDEDEYWVVIITDGEFSPEDPAFDMSAPEFVAVNAENAIVEFANQPLSNGELPRVMCVGIGGRALNFSKIDQELVKNICEINAPDAISAMDAAAKTISGRAEISQKDYEQGNRTLRFNLPYPAKNVIVFAQNDHTTIKDYTCSSKLDVSENYTVSRPPSTPGGADTAVSTVCFITSAGDKTIRAGELSLEFSSPLEPADTVVLVEPSIGMAAHYYNSDGQECDPSQLHQDENVRVEFLLCDSETLDPIDDSVFDGSVAYSAEIDGKTYTGNSIDFAAEHEQLPVSLNIAFSDGYSLSSSEVYTVLPPLRVLALYLPDGAEYSGDALHLSDAQGIHVVPRVNGTHLTQDELESATVTFSGTNYLTGRFNVEKDADTQEFTIYPQGGFLKVFTARDADVTVKMKLKTGETATETLHVKMSVNLPWPKIIIWLLIIAALTYLFVIYVFVKKKFPLDLELDVYAIAKNMLQTSGFQTSGEKKRAKHYLNKPIKRSSVWSPGVIDFVSALPHPGPFKIQLGKVSFEYSGVILIADVNGGAFVEGIGTLSRRDQFAGRTEPECKVYSQKAGEREVCPINGRGFVNNNNITGAMAKTGKKYLLIQDGDMIKPADSAARKFKNQLIRYVRKSTKRKNGELQKR